MSFAKRAAFSALVAAYFLWLAHPGLNAYFNADDTMNLYKEWIRPLPESLKYCLEFWRGDVRPLGQLAYRVIYNLFGWNPLPFRAVCFALIVLNLGLSYMFFLRLAKSDRVAGVALIAACFHGSMLSIYSSTGTIYDVLVQTFMLGALLLFTGVERRGWWRIAAMCLLTIAAIQTKEMGFALPLLAVAYEAVFSPRTIQRRRWFALAAIGAVCAIGFLGLRLASNGVHFQSVAYTPELSWRRYLETTQAHVGMLFAGALPFSGPAAFGVLIAALLLALLMRSRLMLFGWLYFNLALLPLSFTTPRADGYVLYVPLTGFALWVAGIAAWWPETSRAKWTAALVCVCALVIAHLVQVRDDYAKGFEGGGAPEARELSRYASAQHARWPPGARVAVVNDPLEADYSAEAILKLTLNNRQIEVERVRCAFAKPVEQCLKRAPGDYAGIAVYGGGHYLEIRK